MVLVLGQGGIVDVLAALLEPEHFREMASNFLRRKTSRDAALLVENKCLFLSVQLHSDAGNAVAIRIHGVSIALEGFQSGKPFRLWGCRRYGGGGVSVFLQGRTMTPHGGLPIQPLGAQPCFKAQLPPFVYLSAPAQQKPFPFLLHLQAMPGNVQNRYPIAGKAGESTLSLFPLTLPQSCFRPFFVLFFLLYLGTMLLIVVPFFRRNIADRFRAMRLPCRICSRNKRPPPADQFFQTESPVYRGSLYGNVAYPDDGPGTFFLEAQACFRELCVHLLP